jgi:hypothetical protein
MTRRCVAWSACTIVSACSGDDAAGTASGADPRSASSPNVRARGDRKASRSGSLTIGSGSPEPAVDTRRREGKLPAFVVSTSFLATCASLGLPSPPRSCPHESGSTRHQKRLFPRHRSPDRPKTLRLAASTGRQRVQQPSQATPPSVGPIMAGFGRFFRPLPLPALTKAK